MYYFDEYSEGLVINDVEDFNIRHIFDCGQCFRWNIDDDSSYLGVVSGRAIRVIQDKNTIYLKGAKAEDKDF
ncbi:MAG: 8-oxoguanine DNA glycosylase, N-terminal domain-containing protein, partial [Caloramator sp.]|nr:8-oxoguanine DNA glycosylase, N-terminal domain-containing protein [Caloramator sp.]